MVENLSENSEKAAIEALGGKLGFYDMVGNKRIKIMGKIAPNFGVTIQVLAREGDPYKDISLNLNTGQIEIRPDEVPTGKSYIQIASQTGSVAGFWDALIAEERRKR